MSSRWDSLENATKQVSLKWDFERQLQVSLKAQSKGFQTEGVVCKGKEVGEEDVVWLQPQPGSRTPEMKLSQWDSMVPLLPLACPRVNAAAEWSSNDQHYPSTHRSHPGGLGKAAAMPPASPGSSGGRPNCPTVPLGSESVDARSVSLPLSMPLPSKSSNQSSKKAGAGLWCSELNFYLHRWHPI